MPVPVVGTEAEVISRVEARLSGLQPRVVGVGEHYDFVGTIQPLPADIMSLGVNPTAAAEAATTGYHIEITSLANSSIVPPGHRS